MDTLVLDEIVKKIKSLPDNLQRQVLIFVDALHTSSMRGTPGRQLLEFAGTIPLDDLEIMKQTIEAGTEQVDESEW